MLEHLRAVGHGCLGQPYPEAPHVHLPAVLLQQTTVEERRVNLLADRVSGDQLDLRIDVRAIASALRTSLA